MVVKLSSLLLLAVALGGCTRDIALRCTGSCELVADYDVFHGRNLAMIGGWE